MQAEFFTTDGGYVLMDDTGPLGFRFACTAEDSDRGVLLEKGECLKLGLRLLAVVMSPDELGLLRSLVQMAEHRLGAPMPHTGE